MRKTFFCFFCFVNISAFCQLGYNVYYGNLHSHTSNSDGTGTPYEAYTFARDSAHLDFLAVTDHLEYLSYVNFMAGVNAASSLTQDSVFVAFYGYEWTSYNYGHCDVFNTEEMISASSSSLYPGGWETLTAFVKTNPPAFGQFNHPGRYTYFNNWDDFAYINGATDTVFPLIEFQDTLQAYNFYEHALSKGWHLSPVWNQDNHYGDWGLKNNGRAGVWAASLTKNGLKDAIMHRRTFATMDYNASAWIESDSNPMGSVIPLLPVIPIRVVLNDEDNESWLFVELVSDKGVLESFYPDSGPVDTAFNFSDTLAWVFVRAVQQDGNKIWSAPVFFLTTTESVTQQKSDGNGFSVIQNGSIVQIEIDSSVTVPVKITLTDLSGKTVFSARHFSNSEKLVIDLSGYSSGMYSLTVYNSERSFSKKVIRAGS